MHQAPNVIGTARPNGEIDYLSRRWYEITGQRSAVHAPSEAVARAIPPNERGRFYTAWIEAISLRLEFTIPLRLQTATGLRAFEVHARPVQGQRGNRIKWVAAFNDVQDSVAAAERDRELAGMLQRAMGHGLEAAIVMNQGRQTMRAAAFRDRNPSAVLASANRVVFARCRAKEYRSEFWRISTSPCMRRS